jgi:hypothetical protein
VKKGPDKPWTKPPLGWVKLSIGGSFRADDHSPGVGMSLGEENGNPIFTVCRVLDD